MFGIAIGFQGYLLKKVSVPLRIIAIAGGLGLIHPSFISDIIGFCAVAVIIVLQIIEIKPEARRQA
jgi:TRAP-type uncharacterized transport system fused permease subunit